MTPIGATPWVALSDAERRELVRAAAARLRDGELVIAPTETVYGLMANAADDGAIDRLRAATRDEFADSTQSAGQPRFTWHAPGVAALRAHVGLPTPVHRRLVERLLPGPVRFVIEQDQTDGRLAGLGVRPGVIDHQGWLAVRVSSDPVAQHLIETAGVPVVAHRLGQTVFGVAGDAAIGDTPGFPGPVLDIGPIRPGRPSTTVRLALSGAIQVVESGVVTEAEVMDALRRRILFVCTGNTCRSPMAAALASLAIQSRPRHAMEGIEVVIESAGISTGDGLPASPEAVEVIDSMGGDLHHHRSRRLTREMVMRADRVLAMTGSHLARVLDLAPEAAGHADLLDPDGDIQDPIGGPARVYRATAERLRDLIQRHFEELGL